MILVARNLPTLKNETKPKQNLEDVVVPFGEIKADWRCLKTLVGQ